MKRILPISAMIYTALATLPGLVFCMATNVDFSKIMPQVRTCLAD